MCVTVYMYAHSKGNFYALLDCPSPQNNRMITTNNL